MTHNPKLNELYRALCMAERDAREQANSHAEQVGQKSLFGWSQDKHDAYHRDHSEAARAAAKYLFVRMMQIDPD